MNFSIKNMMIALLCSFCCLLQAMDIKESIVLLNPQRLMFTAVRYGDIPTVKSIIARNPDFVNIVDICGNTPLIIASLSRQNNMVKFLMENGAQVATINKAGYCFLNCIVDKSLRLLDDQQDVRFANLEANMPFLYLVGKQSPVKWVQEAREYVQGWVEDNIALEERPMYEKCLIKPLWEIEQEKLISEQDTLKNMMDIEQGDRAIKEREQRKNKAYVAYRHKYGRKLHRKALSRKTVVPRSHDTHDSNKRTTVIKL